MGVYVCKTHNWKHLLSWNALSTATQVRFLLLSHYLNEPGKVIVYSCFLFVVCFHANTVVRQYFAKAKNTYCR